MDSKTSQILLLTCITLFIPSSLCEIEGLYCGLENCYEILGASRDSTRGEITKIYRSLAKVWHPDRHKKQEDKDSASLMFQKIANAYEILKDEESRKDYDYMLDHPEEYYSHYYYYYKRRMAPTVDPKIVVAVSITVISVIQYWGAWNNYNTAINYLVTVPKYRLQAQDIARSDGLIGDKRRKDRSKTKEELKEEEENILKKVLEEKMDIRHEYGEAEREYIVRKSMKLSQTQWEALEDHDREDYLEKELWIKDNFVEWKKQKEEDMKAELATNSRYKSYRRYMKKGGPGQMSFGPE